MVETNGLTATIMMAASLFRVIAVLPLLSVVALRVITTTSGILSQGADRAEFDSQWNTLIRAIQTTTDAVMF